MVNESEIREEDSELESEKLSKNKVQKENSIGSLKLNIREADF